MRLTVALLAVLALTGSAEADYVLKGQFRAPCKMLPPISKRAEPTVPYTVAVWPQEKVERLCSGGRKLYQPVTACAMYPGWIKNKDWIIAVSSFLTPADLACTLVYEKAHMPPNQWKDEAWENQATKGTPYIKRQSVTEMH